MWHIFKHSLIKIHVYMKDIILFLVVISNSLCTYLDVKKYTLTILIVDITHSDSKLNIRHSWSIQMLLNSIVVHILASFSLLSYILLVWSVGDWYLTWLCFTKSICKSDTCCSLSSMQHKRETADHGSPNELALKITSLLCLSSSSKHQNTQSLYVVWQFILAIIYQINSLTYSLTHSMNVQSTLSHVTFQGTLN